MSNNDAFRPDEEPSSTSHSESSKPPYKRPEFIVIDDRFGKQSRYRYHAGEDEPQPDHHTTEEGPATEQGPLSMRFFCFLGLVFCFVFGIGLFIFAMGVTLLALLSFLQNHQLNRSMRSLWKIYVHTVMTGLGFLLGIISPALGLSLIALYFSLSGGAIDSELLRKIIKKSFNRF